MNWNLTLERLRADKPNWAATAKQIGTSRMQLKRIAEGTTRPRIDTAQKIAAHYDAQETAHG